MAISKHNLCCCGN